MRHRGLSSLSATVPLSFPVLPAFPLDAGYSSQMRFFDNSTINRTYLHSTLHSFAEYSGGAFVFVYMLKAGIAIPVVFCTIALAQLTRLIMRQAVVPTVMRIGLRNGLILGTLVDAAAYLVLSQVHGVGLPLAAYILCLGFGSSFYWTCNHAYFAKLGDAEHRGAQVSVREAFGALTSVVAPLLAGFLFVKFNSFAAFASAAAFETLSVLPLWKAPNIQIEKDAQVPPQLRKLAIGFAVADGVLASSGYLAWMIALFESLGENFGSYGGTLAVAGLAGAAMGLAIGRLVDLGHYKHIAVLGFTAVTISILVKAFGYQLPWTAVIASAIGAMVAPIHMSAMMSRVYNLAKSSPCPLRYFVLGEGGWDVGTGGGCLVAAALTYAGFSLFWPLLFGLIGCVLCYWLLSKTPDTAI